MAFGQRSSQSATQFGPNTKVYFVSIKEKDLPQPFFEIKQKVGEKYEVVPGGAVADQLKFLGGDLVDIRNKVFKYEGKDIESVSATFVDKVKDEAYITTLSHGYLGWNIMNSLSALKTYNGIEIGLYQSKPKDGKPKGFNSAAVRQGPTGSLIYGKFKNEELPKIPKIQVGKDVHSDKTAMIAFWTAQMEELSKIVKAANPAGAATSGNTVGTSAAAHEEPAQGGDEGDPLAPPF